MKISSYVEFYGEQLNVEDITCQAKDIWKNKGHLPEDLKKINIYIKPEDGRVYYVFNNCEAGSFALVDSKNEI